MSTAPPSVQQPSWPPPPEPPERPEGVGPTPGRPPWAPWTAIAAFVAGLGGALIGGLIIGLLGALAGASLDNPPPAVNILSTVAQDIAFILAAIFFARLAGRVAPWQFGLRPAKPGPAIGLIALGYIFFISFSAAWVALLGIHAKDELPKELGVDTSNVALAATAVLVCVIAPVAEEFIFRGYIFPALRNWKGLWPAVILDGLIFGGIHAGSAPVGYLVPLALFGSVLCLVYVKTGSLYPCMVLHALNNSIAFGAGVGWDWQIPLVFLGAVAVISAGAVAVRRVFGASPPLPSPV
ncbi:MAG: protease family protein [Solirubrobacteraceae bacterium]|nr:protease family protein [Solirubrobacteraceae bacterium]